MDTTSTADISFMLLIFFLVTTSLDTDEGLTRYLPPMPQKNEQKQMDVNRNDIMNISIDDDDRMTCNGDTINARQLTERVASFVIERGKTHVISVKANKLRGIFRHAELHSECLLRRARQDGTTRI